MKEKHQGPKRYYSDQNQNRYANKFHSLSLISESSIVEEDRNTTDCSCISNLPDVLVQHILFSLSLESAAQTRLLSTGWRDIWIIDFVGHGSEMDLVLAIGDLVHSFNLKCPLKHPWKHRLKFHTQLGFFIVATLGITYKLHLDFSNAQTYPLQQFLLHLAPSNLHPLCVVPFQVKSLCLTSINHLSKDIISSLVLLPSFQFVTTLEIRKCEGLLAIQVLWELKLRHLSIMDCAVESLLILSDELKTFRYRGRVPQITFMDNCKFKDVMLDFRQGPGCYTDSYLESDLPLLPLLNYAHYITLCQWSFEVMMRRRLCAKDPKNQYYNLRELWWIDSSMEQEKINSLVSFLSLCPYIEKLFVTIDPTCYCLKRKSSCSSEVPIISEQLRYLKMVKMYGFENDEDAMLLADHIFNISRGEPVMLAESGNSYTRVLVEISPGRRKFVEELDGKLCNAKHKHMGI